MSIFPTGYPEKSNPIGDDKLLIADSEDGDCIASTTIENLVKGFDGAMLYRIIRYTANDTFVPTPGAKFIEVTVVGGGGGGGGCGAAAASALSIGNSGGGGGAAIATISVEDLNPLGETVTVGAGGAAGAASTSGNGGTGGTSSFGTWLEATGGNGGAAGASATTAPTSTTNTNGGDGFGGDLTFHGGASEVTFRFTAVAGRVGLGGAAALGFSQPQAGRGSNGIGSDGFNYGGGGTAGYASNSTAAQVGGKGAPGIVIVKEYK
jgi:hypothetical protein